MRTEAWFWGRTTSPDFLSFQMVTLVLVLQVRQRNFTCLEAHALRPLHRSLSFYQSGVLGSVLRQQTDTLEIFNKENGSLVLGTNDLERLRIDNDGSVDIDLSTLHLDASQNRIGIGTNSPAQTLHVAGAVRVDQSNPLIQFYGDGSAKGILYHNLGDLYLSNLMGGASDDLLLRTNNVTRIAIKGTGQIGINNDDPQATLHIEGVTRIDNLNPKLEYNNGLTALGYFHHDAGELVIANILHDDLIFKTDNTERMRIEPDGEYWYWLRRSGTSPSCGIKYCNRR